MTIKPKGEHLRNAIKWISQELKYNKDKETNVIIEEACLKFNLSPKDAEYIRRVVNEQD